MIGFMNCQQLYSQAILVGTAMAYVLREYKNNGIPTPFFLQENNLWYVSSGSKMTEHGMFNIPFRVLYALTAILFQTIWS